MTKHRLISAVLVASCVAVSSAGAVASLKEANEIRIIFSEPMVTYLIDPTLRRAYQTLALRASADREAGEIEWAVDGRAVGRAESDSPLTWPLTPGEHHIAARDARGRTAETSIVVR
jgi:membrane carboxypeptidase/penicillin-binding protein PbpC